VRDVVVIGAGHNALVAACYLARDGLDVEVVERDTVVGGACSTVGRWPGYRVDRGSSLHVMVRFTGIIEDLDLDVDYLDLDPWAVLPHDNGGHITFSRDLDATCASIADAAGQPDADAYHRFVADWSSKSRRVLDAFSQPPTARHLGRALWRVGGSRPSGDTARDFLQPGDALLDGLFHDERLKAGLSWLGAQSGPPMHEPGTAPMVGFWSLLHTRSPGRPVGGSCGLSESLARRFVELGGTLRLGDAATAITTSASRASGVLVASGDAIGCRAVLSGTHAVVTAKLLGDEVAAAQVRVGHGIGIPVRIASRAPLGLPPAAMQLLVRDRQQMGRAYGDFLAQRVPADPPLIVMPHSAFDSTLAPVGRHLTTAWAQWHHYDAPFDDEAVAAGVVGQLDTVSPGFGESVEHVLVQSPHELERELGLLRGNVMHVEMGLDSMFALRPLPGWSGYRTPVDGVYLCGASTHPGGGVFGASGRSAARVLLRDRRPSPVARVLRRGGP
jgi:phytoene dehydrogenase-like protein